MAPGLDVHGAGDLFRGGEVSPEIVEGLAVSNVLSARYAEGQDLTHVLLECSDWVCEGGVVPFAFALMGDQRALVEAGSVLLRPADRPVSLTTTALQPAMTWDEADGVVVSEVVTQPFEVAPREPYRWGAAVATALLGAAVLVAAGQRDARLAAPVAAAVLGALAVGASFAWLLIWILYLLPACAAILMVVGLLSLKQRRLRYPLLAVAVAALCFGVPILVVGRLYPLAGSII